LALKLLAKVFVAILIICQKCFEDEITENLKCLTKNYPALLPEPAIPYVDDDDNTAA
jgi:hypothetical protein